MEDTAGQQTKALLVESNFGSRKALLRDLQASPVIASVLEAQSITDGVRILEAKEIDACLIGPSLSQNVTRSLIWQGRVASLNRACTFVAVVEGNSNSVDSVLDCGADAAIIAPYEQTTFTTIVDNAIREARTRADNRASSVEQTTNTQNPDISLLLSSISHGLREVAENITGGTLRLKDNGRPSLATIDAMRLVFDNSMLLGTSETQGNAYDQGFTQSILSWFVERVDSPESKATENLRNRLLTLATKSQSST